MLSHPSRNEAARWMGHPDDFGELDDALECFLNSLENVAREVLVFHDRGHHLLYVVVVDKEDFLRSGGGHALQVGQRR